MPSTSQPPPSQESPTPGACIVVIPDYNGSENLAGLLFGGPVLYDDDNAGDLDFPRGNPPDPPSDDDLDFSAEDLYPDNSNEEPEVEHIPLGALIELVSAIQSLACSSHRPSSDPTPRTKVQEPKQFDRTNSQKLQVFLVQLELNFQDRAKAFHMGRTKVTFAQLYLKGNGLNRTSCSQRIQLSDCFGRMTSRSSSWSSRPTSVCMTPLEMLNTSSTTSP